MINKYVAEKLWKDVFGNKEWAQDCFGIWMHRDAWSNEKVMKTRPGNNKSFDYSWNVDHIRPRSSFKGENDCDFYNNYEPMHRTNNQKKADNYPIFTIEDIKYQIFKQNDYFGYGIRDLESGKAIDWKSVQGRKYG